MLGAGWSTGCNLITLDMEWLRPPHPTLSQDQPQPPLRLSLWCGHWDRRSWTSDFRANSTGWIVRLNRKGPRGSPCCMPLADSIMIPEVYFYKYVCVVATCSVYTITQCKLPVCKHLCQCLNGKALHVLRHFTFCKSLSGQVILPVPPMPSIILAVN